MLGAVQAQKDISLVELTKLLRADQGASSAASIVWRFLDRHGMTFKKTAHAAEQERPTSPSGAGLGSTRSLTSTRTAWSSSLVECQTRSTVRRPRWLGYEAAPFVASGAAPPFRMDTG